MTQSDDPAACVGKVTDDTSGQPRAKLRLYIARSTPNSARAERNLSVALGQIQGAAARYILEIIDVFTQPKRAIIDGVVVTPTLIGSTYDKRIVLMGDLSDEQQLKRILQDLTAESRDSPYNQSSGAAPATK